MLNKGINRTNPANYTNTLDLDNNGQIAEDFASFTFLGVHKKPDNIKGTDAPDLVIDGIGYQVKTSGATLCKGWNLEGLKETAADCYMLVSDKLDYVAVIEREDLRRVLTGNGRRIYVSYDINTDGER